MSNNETSAFRRGLSVLGKLLGGSRKGPSGERARHLGKLQKRIGIRFTDLSLLEQALTHRSYSHVTAQTRNDSNERMEFLGDSVLGLCVSQFLYLEYSDRSEGALSKMKSLLVSRKVLSLVSRNIGLGEYLLLSGEESDMGGRDRTSILADSFEGLIGAIYLDQGYRAANRFIRRFLLADINSILKDEDHTNFKSLLQEYVQSKRLSHPVYRVRKEEGPEHEKEFAVDVVVRGDIWGSGRGKSKKDAEQNAARAALESRQGKLKTRSTSAPTRSEGRKRRGTGKAAAGAAVAGAETGATASPEGPAEARPARARRPRGEHGLEASKKRLEEERLQEERDAKAAAKSSRPPRTRRRAEAPAGAAGEPGTVEDGERRRPRRGRRRRGGTEESADAPQREVVSREELRAETRRAAQRESEPADGARDAEPAVSRGSDSRETASDAPAEHSEGRSRRSRSRRSRRTREERPADEPRADEPRADKARADEARADEPRADERPADEARVDAAPAASESRPEPRSPERPQEAVAARRGRRPRRISSRPGGGSTRESAPSAPAREESEPRERTSPREPAASREESAPREESGSRDRTGSREESGSRAREAVEVPSGGSSGDGGGFTPRRKRTTRGSRRA